MPIRFHVARILSCLTVFSVLYYRARIVSCNFIETSSKYERFPRETCHQTNRWKFKRVLERFERMNGLRVLTDAPRDAAAKWRETVLYFAGRTQPFDDAIKPILEQL